MVKFIINGCYGKMGQEILKLHATEEFKDLEIVGGIYRNDSNRSQLPLRTSSNLTDLIDQADVVIDFTNPQCAIDTAELCVKYNKALICGTTGFDKQQISKLKEISKTIPIFYSANMSLGINIALKLVSEATKLLGSDYDCEILEMHHNQKLDSPSGTALEFGKAVAHAKGMSFENSIEIDRNKKRKQGRIGFASLRGGSIIGDHTVIFAGSNDMITISHRAINRALFAQGALLVARWIANMPAKYLYGMDDFLF